MTVHQIYVNGVVLTSDQANPTAECIAIGDGKIVYVGDLSGADSAIDATYEVVDIQGKCIVPGLIDVHTHMAGHALDSKTVQCSDLIDPEISSVPRMMDAMRARAATAAPGEWVIGNGAMQQRTRLAEKRWPSLAEIDEAVPNNPAYVRFGAHVTIVNSRALEVSGIDTTTPDPPGGQIGRDPSTGALSGVLAEHAFRLVEQKLNKVYGFDGLVDALEASLLDCAAAGITCVHDIVTSHDCLNAYIALHESGRLPIRVGIIIRVLNAEFDADEVIRLKALGTVQEDDMLWLGGGKISIDGGLSGRAGAFKAQIDGHPLCENPILRVDQEALDSAIKLNHEAGVRMCVHAIGDLAVDMALVAFGKAGPQRTDIRHRIEHFGNWLCTEERLATCRELGITPVPNIPFLTLNGDDVWNVLGGEEHYASSAFPFRSLMEDGFILSSGSDGPGYYPVNVLRDMAGMVSRRTIGGRQFNPNEALSISDALLAQTWNGAWLGDRESILGSLEVGKQADLVLLDCQDLRDVPPEEIPSTKILATMIDGRTVYDARQ